MASQRRERLSDTLAYPPRGMPLDTAAAYVGLGRTKFLELVDAELMPQPVDLEGSPRWDRFDLDRAFDDLKEKRADPIKAGNARITAKLAQLRKQQEQDQ